MILVDSNTSMAMTGDLTKKASSVRYQTLCTLETDTNTQAVVTSPVLTQAVAIIGFIAGPVLPPFTALKWISARIPVAITGRCAGRPI